MARNSGKAKAAMFVFNDGNHDQRVHKQAQALGRQGFEVRVYGFLQQGQAYREVREGYTLYREDQRGHWSRLFDDQVGARLKKSRPKQSPTEQPPTEQPQEEALALPPERPPERPCRPPERVLRTQATEQQRQHWAYIKRINGVWARRAASWKPDLVQAHDLDALEGAVQLGQALRIPVLYDTHELWSEQPFIDSQEAVDYWDRLEGRLLTQVTAVMTINQPLANILKERYGLDQVTTLHNCQERQKLPEKFPNPKPVALYQGAYVPDRGLEQVIAAAALVTEVQIAFRGFGASEERLRQLDRSGRVQFLDPVPGPQVVQAASSADIGLIPFLPTCMNHYLSTPNKLFEYMSAGLAVAGSDIPEVARFVGEHQLGELFDPYSPSDIAGALDRMVTSGLLPAMQKRSLAAAQESWNWETEVQKYLDLVHTLLGTRS